jgi:D-glycero-D-manno-heptose 1,7-bisphosphate phosphatase
MIKIIKTDCIFLDRDGVINKDTGYVKAYEEIKWTKNIFKAISFIKKRGIIICVITNQSGVARGFYKEKNIITLHKKMNDYIKRKTGYKIDNFEYCPYLEGGKISKYNLDSYRRKPKPGMITDFIKIKKIKKENCLLFGDKKTDLICAKRAGIKGYLVRNENLFSLLKKKLSSAVSVD